MPSGRGRGKPESNHAGGSRVPRDPSEGRHVPRSLATPSHNGLARATPSRCREIATTTRGCLPGLEIRPRLHGRRLREYGGPYPHPGMGPTRRDPGFSIWGGTWNGHRPHLRQRRTEHPLAGPEHFRQQEVQPHPSRGRILQRLRMQY